MMEKSQIRVSKKVDSRKILLNISFAVGFILLVGTFTELTFHIF